MKHVLKCLARSVLSTVQDWDTVGGVMLQYLLDQTGGGLAKCLEPWPGLLVVKEVALAGFLLSWA